MSAEPNQMTLAGVPEAPQQNGMIAMMERLALNPDLPVEKLEKMLDMQIKIRAIEAEQAFNEAMAKVQKLLPTVARISENEQTNSTYAKHDAIAKAIKPVYTEAGFSITFSQGQTELPDHVRIVGVLRHRDGHKETMYCDVAVDKTGIRGTDNKTLTHAEGSSFTYGRRYLTCLMFDVATGNDNDGNGADGSTLVINADQVTVINDKIVEAKTSKATFLNWLKAESVETIRASKYKRAVEKLDDLIAKKAAK